MRTFTDANGNEWEVTANAFTLRNVKQKTGVALPSLVEDKMEVICSLHDDPILLADVVWVLIAEQAAEKGVTLRQSTCEKPLANRTDCWRCAASRHRADLPRSSRRGV